MDTTCSSTTLPENYVLNEHDVLCGRGSSCYNHVGNQRFRLLVAARLWEYSRAASKLEKSAIISSIVAQVRQNSGSGGFVRKDPLSGTLFEVGDFLAVSGFVPRIHDLKSPFPCDTCTERKLLLTFRIPSSNNPCVLARENFAGLPRCSRVSVSLEQCFEAAQAASSKVVDGAAQKPIVFGSRPLQRSRRLPSNTGSYFYFQHGRKVFKFACSCAYHKLFVSSTYSRNRRP